jgi:hypothetical protein
VNETGSARSLFFSWLDDRLPHNEKRRVGAALHLLSSADVKSPTATATPLAAKAVGHIVSMTANGEKLRRHEAKFANPTRKRQRRSTPNLRGQVLELHKRGTVPADTLNVSDRRLDRLTVNAGEVRSCGVCG